MQRAMNHRKKIKLGFGLIILIALLLVANKFEENNLAEIDQSFTSIYKDRLVPATSIFEMRENLYLKREALEKALHSTRQITASPEGFISNCNENMDSLLAAYKQTYFLEEESSYLHRFEQDLTRYNAFEGRILERLKRSDRSGAAQIFEEEANIPFEDAVLQLSNLNHIQMEIGKDLVIHEKSAGASLKMLFHLETGLILLIALIFHILLRKSMITKGNPIDQVHLN